MESLQEGQTVEFEFTVARSELAMAAWVGPLSGRLAWIQRSGLPSRPKPAEPSRSISSW